MSSPVQSGGRTPLSTPFESDIGSHARPGEDGPLRVPDAPVGSPAPRAPSRGAIGLPGRWWAAPSAGAAAANTTVPAGR